MSPSWGDTKKGGTAALILLNEDRTWQNRGFGAPHFSIQPYLSLGLSCFNPSAAKWCEDLKASATNAAALLSYPGTFRFPLVLQEPLTNYEERMAVNVSCAAMGQTGPCAPEAVTSGLSGFPCRQVPRERRSKSLTCYVAPWTHFTSIKFLPSNPSIFAHDSPYIVLTSTSTSYLSPKVNDMN